MTISVKPIDPHAFPEPSMAKTPEQRAQEDSDAKSAAKREGELAELDRVAMLVAAGVWEVDVKRDHINYVQFRPNNAGWLTHLGGEIRAGDMRRVTFSPAPTA